ncbi:MAG: PolC-type DNA polymerase III [Lachnospiraceae bacterium]|nr:PolC-type DNA polymerase III [Lachnospiraceae bacterium]
MEKDFIEVFPGLQVSGDLADLLDTIQVTRVGVTRKKDWLRVYIISSQWIHKKHIFTLERAIKNQFFANVSMQVRIIERFVLSKQYTPENLLEVYRDSIMTELREYSIFLSNLFHTAQITFPNTDEMNLSLVDSVIAHEREEELYGILEKIFCERCGLNLKISIEYREQEVSEERKNSELKLVQQVRHLVKNTQLGEELALKAQARQVKAAAENAEKHAENSGGGKTDGKDAARNPAKVLKGPWKEQKSSLVETDRKSRRPAGPDVIYGRDFDDEAVTIASLEGDIGDATIRGQVLGMDMREIRNERTILMFQITDFTDTITVKIFLKNEQVPELKPLVDKGTFLKIKGKTAIDSFDHDITMASVWGIKTIRDFREGRSDNAPVKRVELHCHTKMSDMDGVTDASVLVKRAYSWGHPAIAITDHGVVQGFPEANHAMEDIDGSYRKRYAAEHPDVTKEELKKISAPFKVIYGVEAYLVDDLKGIVTNSQGQTLEDTFVVFDLETTGFSPVANKIIEIGAVRVERGKITQRFSTFVNPEVPIPFKIENLTGINDAMVMEAPVIEKVLPEFLEFCQDAVMVAHNAGFDMSFIEHNCEKQGIQKSFTSADTVAMARFLLPGLNRFKLDTVAKAVGVSLDNHHRAVDDAACTADIFVKFVKMLRDRGIENLDQLNEKGSISEHTIRKLPSAHAIILATGETGRVNLYRLISESHLKYYNRRPKLPKSLYLKYSEGLMIGSACEAGELYQALLRGAPDAEITRLVEFYDYLEIQPLGNNRFMLNKEDISAVNSIEDLQNLNKKIVKLGEQFQKPVVATCDVHFMDPEDEIYRRIIMTGKGFSDADDQAPLFLRTTDEMLEEFSYLGTEKAQEVVITNPRKISDMIEKISPIRAGKFPPVIENSDRDLRDICYNTAHEVYGENLPEIVEARLEKELNSIISNGYAVMYIIAQKLVWKSNEDGYLVGSRGSVGSSFVATMSGITEVNPLSPHYLCEKCHYVDFDSPEVKEYAGRAGCDMPDCDCPNCHTPMKKMGFDIPFETFLGFKGNKEPDIDLNFSGEYQSKAHKYTEVIFGAGQTFRAGTIGTLAEKTAFGYVKNYYEERGVHKRNCEIDRIVKGCTGIRRTTGQHPGGIIVLPFGEDINSFTPVQHPANDNTTDIITTHFDYHSIDSNLLKLDILGHDDPTMIRMLEDLTGYDAQTVPLDDQSVMSLFKNTEALGIRPEQIGGCPLGCLGVPEFGTDFVIQMLQDTKPQSISDLIRISGLSHGTDVWLGNAQTLIEEGKATISTAICTRDDIMTYLIGKGLDSEESFTIMESVRKGKGLKPEWETEMTSHGVPEWYIWSCKKIKYMFPKAHAAAYVMMAYRIAYYKIFYPLAYYAAYFSIRASAFSYELMCMGQERLEYYMHDYEKRKDILSKKEQDTYKDMKVVQEMYARGFEFVPVDLYTGQAHRFSIVDNKLMPALDTIEGLGDKAADAVVLAARDGIFLSKDDFRNRTKVSKTVIDLMDDLGIFGDIPESNQYSLFDM